MNDSAILAALDVLLELSKDVTISKDTDGYKFASDGHCYRTDRNGFITAIYSLAVDIQAEKIARHRVNAIADTIAITDKEKTFLKTKGIDFEKFLEENS